MTLGLHILLVLHILGHVFNYHPKSVWAVHKEIKLSFCLHFSQAQPRFVTLDEYMQLPSTNLRKDLEQKSSIEDDVTALIWNEKKTEINVRGADESYEQPQIKILKMLRL